MIDETVEEIQSMQTHSSSVVAVKAARALSELLEREYNSPEEYERDLEHNAGVLRRANPSHASLHKVMRDIVDAVVGEASTVEEAKELTATAIDEAVEDIEAAKHHAAQNAADLLDDGETILTHDYSSTVLDAVGTAVDDGIQLGAYVTEARPRYLGRKTARTFAGIDGVDTTLVVDSAAGHVLDDCDRVVVGMTCIADDVLYNRVGTFPIAAAANRADVPVTVVGSGAKVIKDEFVFENEERSPIEVMREPAEGFSIQNPAYDATPIDLVDQVVTDEGVETY